MPIIQMLIGVAAPVLVFALLLVAIKIRFGNHSAVASARKSAKSLRRTLCGDLMPMHDGRRDFRVAAGLAIKKRKDGTKEWISQGALSDETIHSIAP